MHPSSHASAPDTAEEEGRRYARQLILPEFGAEGQKALRGAGVLIVGMGGLGAPAGLYLAAAGIGRLDLIDFDTVDISNLHRQVLFRTADIGRPKVDAAADRLQALNPHVRVRRLRERLDAQNAVETIAGHDLVIDATDNFRARYIVNDACVIAGVPCVHASIFRFEGLLSVFAAPGGPCYRCLYPEPPPPGLTPSCAEGGVLGVLPGVMGLLQATEAIKLLLGKGDTLVGRLLQYDALTMRFREFELERNPDCPICAPHAPKTIADYPEDPAAGDAAGDEVVIRGVSPRELRRHIGDGADVFLLDVREAEEFAAEHIPGAVHVPLGELDARLEAIPRDGEILCYCLSGGRSARAAKLLASRGFRNVANLAGGILNWKLSNDAT